MTKLEERLKELGYKKRYSKVEYFKRIYGGIIHLTITDLKSTFVEPAYIIYSQQQIDNLQQAFNEMQKDLEVLRNVEN
jgi:hypothetical protein